MSSASAWASASGFHSSRKSVGIEDPHAGGDLEAAGAAQHDQARDARARESLEQGARRGRQGLGRLAEAGADGADGEIVAGRRPRPRWRDRWRRRPRRSGRRRCRSWASGSRTTAVTSCPRASASATVRRPDAAARAEDGDPHRLLLMAPIVADAALGAHEPRQPGDGEHGGDEEVQAQAEDVLGRVDAQQLLEDPEGRVARDVEREEPRRADGAVRPSHTRKAASARFQMIS